MPRPSAASCTPITRRRRDRRVRAPGGASAGRPAARSHWPAGHDRGNIIGGERIGLAATAARRAGDALQDAAHAIMVGSDGALLGCDGRRALVGGDHPDDFHPPALAVLAPARGAPRRPVVNSTARPTLARPECPVIRPSMPAALAAAVRRRAIDGLAVDAAEHRRGATIRTQP